MSDTYLENQLATYIRLYNVQTVMFNIIVISYE